MTTYEVLLLILLTPIATVCACALGLVVVGFVAYWRGK